MDVCGRNLNICLTYLHLKCCTLRIAFLVYFPQDLRFRFATFHWTTNLLTFLNLVNLECSSCGTIVREIANTQAIQSSTLEGVIGGYKLLPKLFVKKLFIIQYLLKILFWVVVKLNKCLRYHSEKFGESDALFFVSAPCEKFVQEFYFLVFCCFEDFDYVD